MEKGILYLEEMVRIISEAKGRKNKSVTGKGSRNFQKTYCEIQKGEKYWRWRWMRWGRRRGREGYASE